jgi:O-antigen/teichoic acid export membrane protein
MPFRQDGRHPFRWKERPISMLKRVLHSRLFRSSAAYSILSAINAAIPFLIMPVLTRHLTPTDYGIVSMLAVLVGIANSFVGLNLHGAISVRYFDRAHPDMARYIGNLLLPLLVSAVAAALLLWLFAGPISSFTAFPRGWLSVVVVLAAGQFVPLVLLSLWQAQNKPYHYGTFHILQTAVNIGLTLLLVVSLGLDWQGRVIAQTSTVAIFAIIAAFILWRGGWVRFSYDRADMVHALRFGVPLIPHALGGIVMSQTDRIFITKMVGIADTGIYTVGFQMGMIIELLASSFNKAYVPWLFQRLAENDTKKKREIVKFTYLYFAGILGFALLLTLIAPWFLSFFVGPKFAGASRYIAWIAIGFAFRGMYYMVTNYVFYAAATHILAWVTFASAVANIVMNYVLITLNGAVGAAQASAAASVIMFVLTWILSARAFSMPWGLRRAET